MGAPRAYYLEWNPENCTLQGAIPVGSDVSAGEGSERIEYPAGRALKVSYLGPYDGLAQAWSDAWEQVRVDGLTAVPDGPYWDDYVTDPGSEPDPTKWQTDIYIAVE
jgi:effector-binding domain-containing protein